MPYASVFILRAVMSVATDIATGTHLASAQLVMFGELMASSEFCRNSFAVSAT